MKYSKLFFSLLVLLLSLAPNRSMMAQDEATRTTNNIFLPMISSGTNSQSESTISGEELIKSLNERYAGTGISFFVFDRTKDGMLTATSDSGKPFAIESNKVVKVANLDELFSLVDSMHNQSQENETGVSSFTELPEGIVRAADITRYGRATWYQAACGGGAYYLGGVFCWKNIEATFTAYNSGYVYNVSVTNSYLTGINILTWQHSGGSGYRTGNTFTLTAWGRYTMGIQAYGLTIGATWNDTWTQGNLLPPSGLY